MIGAGLVWIGSAVAGAWGLAHLALTPRVLAGFPPLSESNRRIVTMEWVAQGLVLLFVAALTAWMPARTSADEAALARSVVRACAAFLLVLAAWTRFTAARGGSLPMRVSPLIKTAAAALLWVGTTA